MNSISLPNVNATLNSIPTPSTGERRVLICGQQEGTITGTTVTENVNVLSNADIKAKFGANSMLTASVLRFLEASSSQCPIDVLSVDAPSGGTEAAAASTATLSGTATVAGTIKLNVVSKSDYAVSVSVAVGDTAAAVATALYNALDALTIDLPFTFADDTSGALTFTAAEVGTLGNYYPVSVEDIPEGLTATVVGFTGGVETPTLTSILDNVSDTRYTGILWPVDWYSSLSEVQTFLSSRFNASNEIMDGVAVTTKTDTSANLITAVSSLNDKNIVIVGTPTPAISNAKFNAITYQGDLQSAEILAYRDTRLTTNANVADITATSQTLDQVGGIPLASLPYFNTPLQYTPQPSDTTAMFTLTQQQALATAGITVIGKNKQNTAMLQGVTVTTYNTDTQGNDDVTFKYLNYLDTGSVIREYVFNNLKADFVQSRLTDGSLRPGRSFANAQSIRSRIIGYLNTLANSDLYGSLVQAGTQAERFIDQHLTVTTDLANRTVTIGAQIPIVTQLGTINFPMTIVTTIS